MRWQVKSWGVFAVLRRARDEKLATAGEDRFLVGRLGVNRLQGLLPGNRLLLVLFAVFAAAALAPPGARAATPFTVGSGARPTVAVGEDGTGHVVWTALHGGRQSRIGYCRLPADATACDHRASLRIPGAMSVNTLSRATVFVPKPRTVVVVAGCWGWCDRVAPDPTLRWISTDNGATFSGPVTIGYEFGSGGFGAWLDGGIFVGISGGKVKAMGAAPTRSRPFVFDHRLYYDSGEIVRVPGTGKLVAAGNDFDTIGYAVYDGPHDPAAINDERFWLRRGRLAPAAETEDQEAALSAGPAGVFLTHLSPTPSDFFRERVGLRSFDSSRNLFGAATYVEGDHQIETHSQLAWPDSAQDSAGRVHLVWHSSYDDNRLRYRVTDKHSSDGFTQAATLAAGETFVDPEVAADGSGRGFVVWRTPRWGNIRVVAIDPQPENYVYDGSLSLFLEPDFDFFGESQDSPADVPGGELLLTIPRACVRAGQEFGVTLTWRRDRQSPAEGEGKFKGPISVDLEFDGRKRTDRQPPFTQTLRFGPDTEIGRLRAGVLFKNPSGKPSTQVIRAKIDICLDDDDRE